MLERNVSTVQSAAFTINLTAVDKLLGRTQHVALGEFRCPREHAQFKGGGPQSCHYIVFPRNPVRIAVHGGAREVAAPGTLRFYNIADSYDRSAVGGWADESDWIALSPQVLADLLAQYASGGTTVSRLFPARSAPLSAHLNLLQRRLFCRAAAQPYNSLALEEAIISYIRLVLDEAALYWQRSRRAKRVQRLESLRRRREIAEDAKEILALDPALDVSIVDLAERVHCSVAHLSRVFHEHTGRSLHGFRQHVRLQRVLESVTGGGRALADIAAEFGYASHSHMTHDFRRHFGVVPSAWAELNVD